MVRERPLTGVRRTGAEAGTVGAGEDSACEKGAGRPQWRHQPGRGMDVGVTRSCRAQGWDVTEAGEACGAEDSGRLLRPSAARGSPSGSSGQNYRQAA